MSAGIMRSHIARVPPFLRIGGPPDKGAFGGGGGGGGTWGKSDRWGRERGYRARFMEQHHNTEKRIKKRRKGEGMKDMETTMYTAENMMGVRMIRSDTDGAHATSLAKGRLHKSL